MKLEVKFGGATRLIDLAVEQNRVSASVDGRSVEADVVEVSPGTYSVLIGSESFEVYVETSAAGLRTHLQGREYLSEVRDPRQWRRNRDAAAEAEGRQKVLAPMPGKVIRLLVGPGDTVEAGQGLVVVEAMKMQNEVRAPKSGTVETILVNAGQTINAGDILGFIV